MKLKGSKNKRKWQKNLNNTSERRQNKDKKKTYSK